LVDVPTEINIGDVAKLAGPDVIVGDLIGVAAAALRADLDDRAATVVRFTGIAHGVERGVGGVHVLSQRLLGIGVLAGLDRVDGMHGVLEIRGGDDHGIHIFGFLIKLFVAPIDVYGVAESLFQFGFAFLTAHAPEVGERDQFKIQFALGFEERGQKRVLEAVGEPDTGDVDAVVRAHDVDGRCLLDLEDSWQGREGGT